MLILDLSQVMLATLHANLKGHVVDVEEGMLRHMILNTIRSLNSKYRGKYGELVIAGDDRNYWRKQYFPYYKAARKKARQDSGLDWNKIFEALNKIKGELKEYFPYRVISIEGAEADDVIGTLCHEFGARIGGEPIMILSGDKDFMQLQKYINVEQYDPVRKRKLKTPDPTKFLHEHIIKGDRGDGIPNILSSDDSIIQGVRQKPITEKRLNEYIDDLKIAYDKLPFEGEVERNWHRNRKLIDLDEIPQDIRDVIMESYNSQEGKNKRRLLTYFVKNQLRNLSEHIGDF